MTEATTTVSVDKNGRITLPKPVREKLEIEGKEAVVEMDVRL